MMHVGSGFTTNGGIRVYACMVGSGFTTMGLLGQLEFGVALLLHLLVSTTSAHYCTVIFSTCCSAGCCHTALPCCAASLAALPLRSSSSWAVSHGAESRLGLFPTVRSSCLPRRALVDRVGRRCSLCVSAAVAHARIYQG